MPQNSPTEPAPGERLAAADFATVIRLTPLVSIDLIVRDETGRILVGRRVHEPAKGSFFVPGGRITKNETRAAAFRRICRAELGREFELAGSRFLGVFDHLYPTNAPGHAGFGTHYVVLAHELIVSRADLPCPPEQHSEYWWATETELRTHSDVHENTRAYVRSDESR